MSLGVYVLGGECPGGKCPGGKCPGGICPWGKCPGGTCLGGLCPRTIISNQNYSFDIQTLSFLYIIDYRVSYDDRNRLG